MLDEKNAGADEADADRRAAVDAADDTGLVREQEEITQAQILGNLTGEADG
jgi:hypothetical protein